MEPAEQDMESEESELVNIDLEPISDDDASSDVSTSRDIAEMGPVKKISKGRFMVDRISDLPEAIMHHILWFLPVKDAQKTSVLSKTWYVACNSSGILKFSQSLFDKTNTNGGLQRFCNFVDETLFRAQETDIQALLISVYDRGARKSFSWSDLDRWLNYGISRKVKYLDVYHHKQYPYNEDYRYTLPNSLWSAESLKELVLFGCKLHECHGATRDVKFSLTKLCLVHVYIDQPTLQSLLSTCRFLEDVSIEHCHGFRKVKLAGQKLTKVSLVFKLHKVSQLFNLHKEVPSIVKIIEAPNLRLMSYGGSYKCIGESMMESSYKTLKEITLRETDIENDLFLLLNTRFPVLEKLKLIRCRLSGTYVEKRFQLQHLPFFWPGCIKNIYIEM